MSSDAQRPAAMTIRLPPGPPGGAATNLTAWVFEPLRVLRWCAERYGDVFTLQLGPFGPFVFVADPALLREVFTADSDLMRAGEPNADALAPLVGRRSVLTSDGPRHLRQRKLLLPPFHGKRLEQYRAWMREAAERLVDSWPVGQPFAVAPSLQRLTLEIIVQLVFGVDDHRRRDRLLELLPKLSQAATLIMFVPPLAADLGPGSPGRRFARLRDEVDAVVMAELAERRASGRRGTDILTTLVDARDDEGQPLTDDELRDELMTLLFAGHETTATALAWAIDLVLHHSEVHERLAAGDGDDHYLDAVISEVHRLRPTVPNVVRRLREPIDLGPWRLPAGAVVAPAIYLVHRRADLYPEPHAFRPERFLDSKSSSYAWLPFGGGVRRCIGASFAHMEMQEVLRAVFGRVDARPADPAPEVPRRRTVTSVPARGTRVIVDQRRGATS